MVKRTGGARRKTRHKLKKHIRTRGKISIKKYFQSFNIGERVCLKAESAYQRGMYPLKHHGKQGIVEGKQGKCYLIKFKDGGKDKIFIVHPLHLEKR